MTTPARIKEAEDASVAFQIALTQIGAKTIEDALTLWEDVPVDARPEVASRWLGRAIRLVLFRRKRSQALALAYYRLARALRTGSTIADPYKPEPTYIRLNDLRREFDALVSPTPAEQGVTEVADPSPTESPSDPESAPEPIAEVSPVDIDDIDEDDPDDLILVEEIKALQAELDRIEKAAEEEARKALAELGIMNSRKKQSEIDMEQDADKVIADKESAHGKAGNRQASSAERIALNGARSTIRAAGERDAKVIGWIRLSRTGTPCGFCAMLISRGPVFKDGKVVSLKWAYGSSRGAKQTSERRGKNITDETDLYHHNCKCYAEAIYGLEEFNDSPLYALNREYAVLWPQVTKGLGGDAALTKWRHHIRQMAKAQAASA